MYQGNSGIVSREALGVYADWKFVPNSFFTNTQRSGCCFVLVSPDFERCVIVLNGKVLLSLDTSEAYRKRQLNEGSAKCQAIDDALDIFGIAGTESNVLTDDEQPLWLPDSEAEEQNEAEEKTGIDPDRVIFFLSPSGQELTFQFYNGGELYLFIDGKCESLAIPLGDVQYASTGKRRALVLCDSVSRQSYLLDGVVHDAQLISSAFNQDGKYFFSVQSCNVREDGQDLIDVCVNGDVVFSAPKIQYWNPPGVVDDEISPRRCFVLDPYGRAAVFGFFEQTRGSTFGKLEPVIGVMSMKTDLLQRYHGAEILDAVISPCEDGFLLTILRDGIPASLEIFFA